MKETRETRRPGKRGRTEIPCAQSRKYDHGKDFSGTCPKPWLLKVGEFPARGGTVDESVVFKDVVLNIVVGNRAARSLRDPPNTNFEPLNYESSHHRAHC